MSRTGTIGEEIAARYLKNQGYRIIEINWKRTWAEIDIVAADPDGTLVFVEVKAMKTLLDKSCYFQPEYHFDLKKKTRVRRAAEYYANLKRGLVNDRLGWRIDLIAVTVGENECLVRHYLNAG